MTKRKDWGRNEPKDTQLLALMTKVDKLEGKKTGPSKRGGEHGSKTSPSTTGTFKYTINPERMKRVGPTKMIDRVLMYWCTLHICPRGTNTGLYCNRGNSGYTAWEDRKESYKANKEEEYQ